MAGQVLVVLTDPILKRELFNLQTHVKANFIFANNISELQALSSVQQIDLLIVEMNYINNISEKERDAFYHLQSPAIIIASIGSSYYSLEINEPKMYKDIRRLTGNLAGEINQFLPKQKNKLPSQSKDVPQFITRNSKMKQVLKDAERVAGVKTNILILGESGTGKDVLANYIHRNGLRKNKPFVKINCAAIPKNLLETELFGAKKGAYTDAVEDKLGKIQMAHTGTLFLDEIGDLHRELQGKLLRVLESGEIDVVGGDKPVEVDVRLISATNQDLWKLIGQGKFRKDLYYRLNVIAFHMAPLRERPEDIPALFEYYAAHYAKIYNVMMKKIQPDYLAELFEYDWPGNVREFKSFVDQFVRKCQGRAIDPTLIPEAFRQHTRREQVLSDSLENHLLKQEKKYLLKALAENHFKMGKTAMILGINRVSLYRKLKKFEIDVKRIKGGESN